MLLLAFPFFVSFFVGGSLLLLSLCLLSGWFVVSKLFCLCVGVYFRLFVLLSFVGVSVFVLLVVVLFLLWVCLCLLRVLFEMLCGCFFVFVCYFSLWVVMCLFGFVAAVVFVCGCVVVVVMFVCQCFLFVAVFCFFLL